ncbi:metal ABC transporter ATP-binding protein [Georgenia yuyongxinii]|uniref:ATP-binding cassette domain-containing protein n=1 Tax=Georgenia yuyongxinii TaxID=2589797 RepID=A0A552WRS9_9MICO|nr:ATP-binding cassette domain-containing protein [Georgenia yuyongxinii]TRW45416.1 ATP-binding cassette domain-containing protein [Georgenia yuyongxinii]
MRVTTHRPRPTQAPPATAAAPVRTHDLSVVLGSSTILRGIDLTISAGETVALLGANGSGKSTLVKSLVGVVPIANGRAELFGADVTSRRVPWARVGYVPQRLTAAGGVPATALEVVSSGLLHGRRLRLRGGARARALAALDQVGLADRAHDGVHVFSGGQQQRVLIARALVREPELLILDEPLAGIDRRSKEALAGTLTDLRARGTTMLIVLHELGELAGLVQRAVVLRHGRVVHDGAPPRAAQGHDAAGHDHVHAHEDQADPGTRSPDLKVEW